MSNLFSLFDPSLSIVSFSTLVLLFPLLFFISMENTKSSLLSFFKLMFFNSTKECEQTLMKKFNVYSFHLSLFFTFLVFNLLSLFPFIFPFTSHVSMILPIGFTFWFVPIISLILKNFRNFLKSLLPQGTPLFLMSFMVLIELVSLMIRPITLSVRLTANITAGHLLISILVNFLLALNFNIFSTIPIYLMSVLELGVAFIQSYVFFTLLNMYTAEF